MDLKELLGEAYKEGMTFEEAQAALQDVALPEPDSGELERLRNALSKSNSEAAEYKKQLRTKMSEEEAAKQKEAEERAELQTKYEALLHETEVSKNKAKLLAIGYDEKLADETAEAMANGDMAKVLVNQAKHLEAYGKKIRAETLKDTPKPTADGGGNQAMTKKSFRAMNPLERYQFRTEHPEEYEDLYGGNE